MFLLPRYISETYPELLARAGLQVDAGCLGLADRASADRAGQ
jgi:hypothetical protein